MLKNYDVGLFARKMTGLIQKNVVDPDLRDWVMPAFSTTTVDDRTTASVLMMGAMQSYFTYGLGMLCGIPSVTLLGTREDWVELYGKLEKLDTLGEETVAWAKLLRPVMKRFIMTFDQPHSQEVKWFWERIVHQAGGSGPVWLSGWITAFCFWRKDGKCLQNENDGSGSGYKEQGKDEKWQGHSLYMDEAKYFKVDSKEIPNGYASVPVQVNDNGIEFKTNMVAGLLGIQAVSSSGENLVGGSNLLDTLQPLSGWIMCLDADNTVSSPAWEAHMKALSTLR